MQLNSDFKIKGHLAMIGANAIWGLMSPIAKLVMSAGIVSPLLMTDMRIMGAAILFWLLSLFTKRETVPAKDLLLLAGAGMLGVLFNQGSFIFGVSFTSPGEASIITTTMPMWVMLFAYILLKEPITLKKVGGIILGASGALILVYSGWAHNHQEANNPLLGDVLVLTAQLSYALYLTFYKNFIKKYSLVTLMKWMFTFASIVILPFSINTISETNFLSLGIYEVLGASYVVVFGTFAAYICIMTGQKNLRPTIVGMYNYLQPIVASIIGVYLGLDEFTWHKYTAVILIFAGVYLVTISKSAAKLKSDK